MLVWAPDRRGCNDGSVPMMDADFSVVIVGALILMRACCFVSSQHFFDPKVCFRFGSKFDQQSLSMRMPVVILFAAVIVRTNLNKNEFKPFEHTIVNTVVLTNYELAVSFHRRSIPSSPWIQIQVCISWLCVLECMHAHEPLRDICI